MTTFAFVCRSADPTQTLHLTREAEALAIVGHQVDIYAPTWPALAEEITQPRVRLIRLGKAPRAHRFSLAAIWFWVHTCITIALAQFRRRYHVIQVSGSTGVFVYTVFVARLLGAKIVLNTNEARPERVMIDGSVKRDSLAARFAVIIEQFIVDSVDHVVVTTEPLRGRYISRGCPPEKISVIYRAPEDRRFTHPLGVVRHADIADRFLVVARADQAADADFTVAINAIAASRLRVPTILLWIACPEEMHADLSAQIRRLDLAKYVLVQGPLQSADIPAFIAQADADLVTTPRDSLTDLLIPEGVFEGLTVGTPTIAVRTQATQYYFDSKALLVYDNIDDLTDRLVWLAGHRDARDTMKAHTRELIAQTHWSRERHRYIALMLALATSDITTERNPADAAGFTRASKRRSAVTHDYRSAVKARAQVNNNLIDDDLRTTTQMLPLRLTPLSQEWRAGRQFRMRLSAWASRGAAAVLLFGIPIVASNPSTAAKIITAIMFAAVIVVMLLLPPGEAAIILAMYFVTQRWLFLHFPPEGILGRVIVYLGTALQLIIFAGFCLRAIIQQRPLLRSGFILWPASLYVVVSVISAFVNHVSPSVLMLGTEHTLHNLIFVVLIAEDLPTPQQLRRYVGVVIAVLDLFGVVSIIKTTIGFHTLGLRAPEWFSWLNPSTIPVSVIEPDADSYAFLLNFGILLALAVFVSLNSEEQYSSDGTTVSFWLNAQLLGTIAILTLAEMQTGSTENWLGLLGGVIALAFILRGKLRWTAGAYLAVLVMLSLIPFRVVPYGPTSTIASRVVAITNGQIPHNAPITKSITLVEQHPLLGIGPGRFGGTVAYITNSPAYAQYGFVRPKSITSINLFWLHITGETGLIGLGIFLWLMLLAEITIFRAYRNGTHRQWHGITAGVFGIVIAMSIATFFGNALEIDSLSAPFWGLVGIAVALPLSNRPLFAQPAPAVRFEGENVQGGGEQPANASDQTMPAPGGIR